MHQANWPLALVCLLFVVACQCRLSVDDNLEENHIEFYQNVHRKVLTTTPRPGRFSIFQKRTRPTFRRNNKHETLLTNYKFISNATEDDQQTKPIDGKRLNKSKASVEFVGIYDGNLNRPNVTSSQHHRSGSSNSSNAKSDPGASSTANVSSSSDLVGANPKAHIERTLTQSQQTMLAFEHGLRMKREAKCEFPKATVVYLNQDREQIKIYMPRATILHRCGQNSGCCERESDRCVAVEQQQVNLYFFVIKLEKEFDELDDGDSLKAMRKARKFASFDQNSNDDGSLKEYEYNLDYTLNNENENSFKLADNSEDTKLFNQFKNENSYLNTLLSQDNTLKQRLTRSTQTRSRRRSKELNLGRFAVNCSVVSNHL